MLIGIILSLLLLLPKILLSQTDENIKEALNLGSEQKYFDARKVLINEIKKNPKNADAYYWLARYSHYIAHDSRPFPRDADNWSKTQILDNLKKAIKLNPQLGDAYYFLAVEYGVRATEALRKHNIVQAKNELLEAKKMGAFPLYVLEYANSILNSCEKNAILIVAGDGSFNAIRYLQLVKGVRKDISLIGLGLLQKPFYVKMVRDGIPNEIPKASIDWDDDLIMETTNYLWKEQEIQIPISKKVQQEYCWKDSSNIVHLIVPDWSGTLYNMSAVITDIFETNRWKRPFYLAFSDEEKDMFLFNDYLQNEGFVFKMMPYKVKDSLNEFNQEKFEEGILKPENYKNFYHIKIHNQPRINQFFGDNRREQILHYIQYLIKFKKNEKAKSTLQKMNRLMPEETFPLSENIKKQYKAIEDQLEKEAN